VANFEVHYTGQNCRGEYVDKTTTLVSSNGFYSALTTVVQYLAMSRFVLKSFNMREVDA
jgi:hypothetical protein